MSSNHLREAGCFIYRASKQVQDAFVSIIAQKINHALEAISGCRGVNDLRWSSYLGHDGLAVLAFHVLEGHLYALSRRNLNAWTVDVGNLGKRDY